MALEKLAEIEDALRVIAQYTRDPWVQEVIERILDDD
jgi:hypothetical protein